MITCNGGTSAELKKARTQCGVMVVHHGYVKSSGQGDWQNLKTTFVTLLRVYAKNKDMCKGSRLHHDIVRRGMLEECSDDLVIMYAKCGALGKASEVFEGYRSKDVFAWTALIEGYAQNGRGHDALYCFKLMQQEGVFPDEVTFSCILKVCGSMGALDRGEQIHDQIARKGFLGNNILLATALIDMYAKCGALAKARGVFEGLPIRDGISWNALIAGYAQQGEGEEALDCLELMQLEGVSPDVVTFTCLLKACGSIKAADKGEIIHNEIAARELLEKDAMLGTALVDMYAKCGAFLKAQRVLEKLSLQDVVSWNALIAGYAQQGEVVQALDCYKVMMSRGISPDRVSFICTLKVCASIRAVEEGRKVHEEIAKQGLLSDDVVLGTALVDMYAKCGALAKAQQVLDALPSRNAISWNALIAGYAQHYHSSRALNCLDRMKSEGISSDPGTFISILRGHGSMEASDTREYVRNEIIKEGLLGTDITLDTALIDAYAKCGDFAKAQEVLQELPVRNVTSWNALLSGLTQSGKFVEVLNCFDAMQQEGLSPDALTLTCTLKACGSIGAAMKGEKIHDTIVNEGLLCSNVVIGNALVDMYVKCGALAKARRVLVEELLVRDVISWNILIGGYAHQGEGEEALNCFEGMKQDSILPDAFTFTCILKACASIRAANRGEDLHREIVKRELLADNVVLGTALVDMYARCGALAKAHKVLEEFPVRNVASWNALIGGLAQQGKGLQVLECLQQMRSEGFSPDAVTFTCILKACGSIGAMDKGEEFHHEILNRGLLRDDILLGTALVDMYAKCGSVVKACQVLDELPSRNVCSWNALIGAYIEHGEDKEALNCFEKMEREGLSPDVTTFACIFKACGSTGAADKGEKIREKAAKLGLLEENVVLGTALVDMYAKCGALTRARQVLEELHLRDVTSWNALIAGYVQQCESEQALNCFEEMQREELFPDGSTFSSILNACSRMDLIELAQEHFLNMKTKYGLEPELDHYSCMVDLYGRAGRLEKAMEVIEMSPPSDGRVWSVLLSACRKWEDVNVGRWAFEHAVQVDKSDTGLYVLMSNLYSALGMEADAEGIEAMHVKNRAWKIRDNKASESGLDRMGFG